MGASDFGYRVTEDFVLRIVPTRPALVPLVFTDAQFEANHQLAGISASHETRTEHDPHPDRPFGGRLPGNPVAAAAEYATWTFERRKTAYGGTVCEAAVTGRAEGAGAMARRPDVSASPGARASPTSSSRRRRRSTAASSRCTTPTR